jgi:ribonuclease E
MAKRMLIDATHAEETRVVVLDGNRLEDFDVETSAKRHLKGNIYLAKVVRVEPSLQAAFVEYGGNRHGFLAFSEIHPDYYQIPVADRQRLLEMEAEEARREEEEDELELALSEVAQPAPVAAPAPASRSRRDRRHGGNRSPEPRRPSVAAPPPTQAWARPETPPLTGAAPVAVPAPPAAESWAMPDHPALRAPATPVQAWALAGSPPALTAAAASGDEAAAVTDATAPAVDAPLPATAIVPAPTAIVPAPAAGAEAWAAAALPALFAPAAEPAEDRPEAEAQDLVAMRDDRSAAPDDDDDEAEDAELDEDDGPPPETLGGELDVVEDAVERRIPPRFLRNYKIQEVIRRRQIMLIQVVKEERGTKGAALTTYLSLAGRFSVLMPNSPRGGGISRKITSAADRRRLKEVMTELDIPRGMGLIIRTAGAARPKPEIKRDCEYLLRLWDDIREHTLKSIAPALIYEEASLIKRAIRDVYSRDIDDIQVDGVEGWRAAHEFMRMLMPTHARKVQLWRDQSQPLFGRYQVDAQLDAMLHPIVQLRSGGYLVINQTEALVAIDVNSGRSTRERNVEETALRTNLEAADEAARQLRLRDLAGLIVIDFIDMESRRHNAMVERRLKDALRNDRARIQVGHISHFGLLEMSRQRLRPSLTETTFVTCPHCNGTGNVRTTESAGIHVLRGIEEEASKRRAAEVIVHVATPIALYLLNHKRERLHGIEQRYGMRVIIAADDTQMAPRFRIERVRAQIPGEAPSFITPDLPPPLPAPWPATAAAEEEIEEEPEDEVVADDPQPEPAADTVEPVPAGEAAAAGPEDGEDQDQDRGRRRRRRRRGRRDDHAETAREAEDRPDQPAVAAEADAPPPEVAPPAEAPPAGAPGGEPVAGPETGSETGSDTGPEADDDGRGRRRGRRGGRRRRREGGDELPPVAEPGAEQPDLAPIYAGPTPADPFGGRVFDIFDALEQAEQRQEERVRPARQQAVVVAPPPPVAALGWADATVPRLLRAEPAATAEPAGVPAATAAPAAAAGVSAAPEPTAAKVGLGPAAAEPGPEPTAAVSEPQLTAAEPELTTAEPEPDLTAAVSGPVLTAAVSGPVLTAAVSADAAVAASVAAVTASPTREAAAPPAEAAGDAAPAAVADATADKAPEPLATPEPANDAAPVAEPLVKPIVIGQDVAAPVERKRGWWRR